MAGATSPAIVEHPAGARERATAKPPAATKESGAVDQPADEARQECASHRVDQTGSVPPQTTASTVAPFFVVTVWTQPFGR